MAKVSPLLAVPVLFFTAVAGLFLGGMAREEPDALPSVFEGGPAPALEAEPLGDLPSFDRATLEQPGVKLVNFFASWCAPCRVEHPVLEALAEEGLPIYGINRDRTVPDALRFLDELGNPYRAVIFDPKNRKSIDWGVYGLPETFVIDGDGKVLLRFAGPITDVILRTRIRPAIAAAETP